MSGFYGKSLLNNFFTWRSESLGASVWDIFRRRFIITIFPALLYPYAFMYRYSLTEVPFLEGATRILHAL